MCGVIRGPSARVPAYLGQSGGFVLLDECVRWASTREGPVRVCGGQAVCASQAGVRLPAVASPHAGSGRPVSARRSVLASPTNARNELLGGACHQSPSFTGKSENDLELKSPLTALFRGLSKCFFHQL